MTVCTLTYIHQLLIENERRMGHEAELAHKARKEAMDAMDEALENGTPAGQDAMRATESVYQSARKSWAAARAALDEFESHEW